MTKKEIIAALEKADIEHDPTALKAELELLLPPETEPENAPNKATASICKQRGCPDAQENADGNCSICGHPIIHE